MSKLRLVIMSFTLTVVLCTLLPAYAAPVAQLAYFIVDDDGLGTSGVTPDCDGLGAALTSVQAAITAAVATDTIHVCPGAYAEALTVDKTLNIIGIGSPVINPPAGTDTYCGNPDAAQPIPTTSPLINVTANGVALSGLVLNGSSGGNTRNIGIARANGAFPSGVSMTGLTFNGFGHLGVYIYGAALPAGSINNTISGSSFNNFISPGGSCVATGVLLQNEGYATITGNTMTNVGTGIRTTTYAIGTDGSENITISGNTISARGTGIFINNHVTVLPVFDVTNNTMTGTGANLFGMRIYSMFNDSTVNVSDNSVTGYNTGMLVWNTPTTATINVTNFSVTGAEIGVDMFDCSSFGSQGGASSITFTNLDVTSGATYTPLLGLRLDDGTCVATGLTLTVNDFTVSGYPTGALVTGVAGGNSLLTLNIDNMEANGTTATSPLDGIRVSANLPSPVLDVNNARISAYQRAINTSANNTAVVTITDSRLQDNTVAAISADAGAAAYTVSNTCIVNNADTAVTTTSGLLNAQGNWWGSSWGPYIASAPGGSASLISTGDSIQGDGNTPVDVDLTSYGLASNNTPPTGNWLTTAPTGCKVCTAASSISRGARSCT